MITPDAVEQPKGSCIWRVFCQVTIEGWERRRNRINLGLECIGCRAL